MKKFLHKIAHKLGWTTGEVVTWFDCDGRLIIGFRCDACGIVTGAHKSHLPDRWIEP